MKKILCFMILLMATGLAAAQIDSYNRYPVNVGASIQADIVVTSLDNSTQKYIIVAPESRDIYVLRPNGTVRWTNVAGQPLSDYGRKPAILDINGDHKKEIISYGNPGTFNTSFASLYIWDPDGNLLNTITVNHAIILTPPAVADIGEKIILVGASPPNPKYSSSGPIGVYAYNSSGSNIWYLNISAVVRTTSIAVGDIDGDNKDEAAAVVDNSSGARLVVLKLGNESASVLWTKDMSTKISGAAIDDVNNDGKNEVIIGSGSGVFVWDGNGSDVWSNNVPVVTHSPPAVGDIDGDGVKDVVIGSDQQKQLFAINMGNMMPGFPVQTVQSVWSKPALTDINDDGKLEIFAGDFGGYLYGWNFNGTTLEGFPFLSSPEAFMSSPVVSDLEKTGKFQIIAGNDDSFVYAFTYNGTYNNTPPVTTDNVDGLWHNSSVTVTLSASDEGSGVAATYHTTDGSEPTVYSASGTTIILDNDGIYTIKYFSVDKAGNVEAVKTSASQVKIDKTPPSTTDDADTVWHNSSIVIALTPSDTGTGVRGTYYTIDGSEPTTDSSNGTIITIGNEGLHTIKYFSTDNAGNAEPVRQAFVKIDSSLPVTLDDTDNLWHNTDVNVSLNSTDFLSGVASIYYAVDGPWQVSYSTNTSFALTSEGVHQIKYYGVDGAGNAELEKIAYAKIDKTAPVTLDDADGEWHNSNVTVKLTASDNLAGVNSTYYKVTSGSMTWIESFFSWFTSAIGLSETPTSMGGNVSILDEGVFNIQYYSTDNAANTEVEKTSRQVMIDKTLPAVTVNVPENKTYLRSDIIALSFSALDSLSGIKTLNSTIDGNRSVSDGQSLDMLEVGFGAHEFSITAKDNASNLNIQKVGFNVIATIDSLKILTERGASNGWITNNDVANDLIGKVNSAKQNIDAGQNMTAKNLLQAYVNDVQAQAGTSITTGGAGVLTSEAIYIIDQLQGSGYVNGTVTNGGSPVAGAVVFTNGSITTTSSNGAYSLILQAGTYNITASKQPEYYDNTTTGIIVTQDNTSTQDFELALKPTGTISGTVMKK